MSDEKNAANDAEEELYCVWELGSPCGGEVKMRAQWKGINLPVCEKHYQEHLDILMLVGNGMNPNKVLNESPEWRKKQALIVKLSGMNQNNNEDFSSE